VRIDLHAVLANVFLVVMPVAADRGQTGDSEEQTEKAPEQDA
jgi:hypothetical protein